MKKAREITKNNRRALYNYINAYAAQGGDVAKMKTAVSRRYELGTIKRENLVKAVEMPFDEWNELLSNERRKTDAKIAKQRDLFDNSECEQDFEELKNDFDNKVNEEVARKIKQFCEAIVNDLIIYVNNIITNQNI